MSDDETTTQAEADGDRLEKELSQLVLVFFVCAALFGALVVGVSLSCLFYFSKGF